MHTTNIDDHERTLTELITSRSTIAMINTMIGREHSSRPVTIADVQDARLSFLVSRQADWVGAVAGQQAIVHITVADDSHSLYLSLNGTALAVTDPQEAVRLWRKPASIWFHGPDDPNLMVLHFDVSDGRYWDGPNGTIGKAMALAKAALTGRGDSLGTDGPVATAS